MKACQCETCQKAAQIYQKEKLVVDRLLQIRADTSLFIMTGIIGVIISKMVARGADPEKLVNQITDNIINAVKEGVDHEMDKALENTEEGGSA